MRMLTSNLLNLAKRDGGLKVELTSVDQTYFEKYLKIINYSLRSLVESLRVRSTLRIVSN